MRINQEQDQLNLTNRYIKYFKNIKLYIKIIKV